MLHIHSLEVANAENIAKIGGSNGPTSLYVTSGVNIWGVLIVIVVFVVSCFRVHYSKRR